MMHAKLVGMDERRHAGKGYDYAVYLHFPFLSKLLPLHLITSFPFLFLSYPPFANCYHFLLPVFIFCFYNPLPKVILGGGRRELMPVTVRDVESNQPGRRMDGKNLIQTWLKTKKNPKSAKYAWNKQQLFNVNVSETDYLLGK